MTADSATPIASQADRSRRPWLTLLLPALTGLFALASYLLTAAPSITWAAGSADSGELATAAYHWGVAHPTGYPLWTAVAALFTHLPFGEPAYRTTLFSAASAAGCVALITALTARVTTHLGPFPSLAGSAAAGLLLAVSPMFWSQAVVTEVYAFNAVLLAAICLLAERAAAQPLSARTLLPLALLAGAGLAHHSTIILLLAAVAGRLALTHRLWRQPLTAWVPWPLVTLLAAFVLYALLPLRADANPAAVWGDPSLLQGLAEHATGAAYRGALFTLPLSVVLTKAPALARMLLEQFGPLGYLLMLAGIWRLWGERPGFARWWIVAVALYVLFALNYTVLDSQIYLLPAFVLVAVPLGAGVATLTAELLARAPNPGLARLAGGVAVALLALGGWWASFPAANRSADREAPTYALTTLNALPRDATVVTREDRHSFSLWYLQSVLGVRPDVHVVDGRLVTWPWYRARLPHVYPGFTAPLESTVTRLDELRAVLAANAQFPTYVTFGDSPLSGDRLGALDLWQVNPAALQPRS